MASRLKKLLPASFRGIEFFVRTESLSDAGRKVVLHEYPNSSERYVEDQGQIPARFKVQAFISGDDWIQKAKSLETVLNKKGAGRLVMPTFGSVNIYALPYTKDASQSEIGIITFNLDFAIGKPANAPAQAATTQQEVFEKGDAARAVIQTKFAEKFKKPSFIDNIITVVGDIKDSVTEVVAKIKDKIPIDKLREITQKAQKIQATVARLIDDPEALAFELIQGSTEDTGIWQLVSLGMEVNGHLQTLKEIAEYGGSLLTSDSSDEVTGSSVDENDLDETSSNTPYWPETTHERTLRNESRHLVVRNNRLNALVVMYEQLSAQDYNTTEEINTARETVEDIYTQIMLDGTDNDDAFQSDQDIRLAVEDVRLSSLEVLNEKDQQVFGLVSLEQRIPTSKFVLAYNLYAEDFTTSTDLSDRSIILGGLNSDQNGLAMDGTLTVLQNRVIS